MTKVRRIESQSRVCVAACQAKRAFTLIELLVVIAIIAVLVAILLPSLAGARNAGRLLVSLSNMKQLATVQFTYAGEFKDSFVNPFDKDGPVIDMNGTSFNAPWFTYLISPSESANLVEEPRSDFRCTEAFAFHWVSPVMNYIDGKSSPKALQVMVSPADDALNARVSLSKAAYASSTVAQSLGTDPLIGMVYVMDTSYWYPPTFWLTPAKYSGSSHVVIDTSPAGAAMLRRNLLSNVITPQGKVMLFERFDYTKKSRTSPSQGTVKYPPNWNNPESTTRYVTADGSAGSVKMKSIYELSASTNPAEATTFTPSGHWDMNDDLFHTYPNGAPLLFGQNAELENGRNGTARHPAHFWATRNGVQGRDVNR